MVIYYCKICGMHQDIALAKYLKDAWNSAMKSRPDAQIPQGYPCPSGHDGLMVQLQPGDRIRVEAKTIEAGGEESQ